MASKRKGATTARPATRSAKSWITRRILNSKRHTVAYIVGGQRLTVEQVRAAAAAGRVAAVRVVGDHIQAAIGARPLYALPTTVEKLK